MMFFRRWWWWLTYRVGANPMIRFYIDAAGEHRWRIVARNGNILADSGEGYKRRASAVNGLASVLSILLKEATVAKKPKPKPMKPGKPSKPC